MDEPRLYLSSFLINEVHKLSQKMTNFLNSRGFDFQRETSDYQSSYFQFCALIKQFHDQLDSLIKDLEEMK